MTDSTSAADASVIVVGGGIAGLSAAWQLKRDGMPVRLFEAADRVGGKIRASTVAGALIDEGADAFLARVPHGIELASELGLADRLTAPATRAAQIWAGDSLVALPQPNVLGIPLERDAVVELLGAAAGDALDADLGRTNDDPVRDDDSIGSLVRRRLGDVIHEGLVDPLMGAINAGNTDEIAITSSPQILAAANAGPSLVNALRNQIAGRRSDAPVFHSFDGGMTVLIDALAQELRDEITTGAPVTGLTAGLNGSVTVALASGETCDASAVVLACEPQAAAKLTAAWPDAARTLDSIPLVSIAFITMAFPAGTVDAGGGFSGFVVPRTGNNLTIAACSYGSKKWPSWAGEGNLDVLRMSVGHGRDQTTPELSDDEIIAIVRADLKAALGIESPPIDVRVTRWPQAFPQYVVGHDAKVDRIEAHLNPDGVFVAGMGYRGIGIPACIDQGRTAAVEAILHTLEHRR